jgi:hypothetical protein
MERLVRLFEILRFKAKAYLHALPSFSSQKLYWLAERFEWKSYASAR